MGDGLAHAGGLRMVAGQGGMVGATDDEQRALLAPIAARAGKPRGDEPPLSEEQYLALWPSLLRDLVALGDLRRRGMIHSHDGGQQAVLRDIDRLLESVTVPED